MPKSRTDALPLPPGAAWLAAAWLLAVGCVASSTDGEGTAGGNGGQGITAGSGGASAGDEPGGSGGQAGSGNSGAGAGGSAAGGSSGSSGGQSGEGSGGSGSGGAAAGGSGGNGAGGGGGQNPDPEPEDPTPDAGSAASDAGGAPGDGKPFSFFYTSLDAMRRLSGSQNGFGGDLRFGEETGLAGADKICQTIAAGVGAGGKTWRAFLSVVRGPEGGPGHAIDRIGEGPWYDRNGRLIAMNKADLIAEDRPKGDPQTVSDLPDENGMGARALGDTHDAITGSNREGRLRSNNLASTCQDWTSASGGNGVGAGHSWPANSGRSWVQVHAVPGCTPSVNLTFTPNTRGIGGYGGWGGFYCFALTP